MGKIYKDVDEMTADLSTNPFYFVRLWCKKHFPIKCYQKCARIYLDEYQSNEPEIETDNFFYQRFLRRI